MAVAILASHGRAFGRGLLTAAQTAGDPRQAAQALFSCDRVVLAHDAGSDPRLVYANRAALRLWRRRWGEMVGLPSRLTAEPQERSERARALEQAMRQEALSGYAGIRVDSSGRRVRINGARLWSLDKGQAASFADWWWL